MHCKETSPGSLQDLLTRKCKRPWLGSACQGPWRESHNIVKKRTCCCWRGSCKILRREPPKSIAFIQAPLRHGTCKILVQGPLRKDYQDLHKIFWQGPVQDHAKTLHGCQQDFHKIFSPELVQVHARASNRISSGSSQHLLTRTSARPWSRPSHITGLQNCTMKLVQDRHRRTFHRTHKVSLPGSQNSEKFCENQNRTATRNESDATRIKCPEGCASDIKIHTEPQRERSETHKVMRGLCER